MPDTRKVTYEIKGKLAVVTVVKRVQLTSEANRITTSKFVVEIPDGIVVTREYIMRRIDEQ